MGRSAAPCRSARPHTPHGDRRRRRSWLVSAVELRLGKIRARLAQDLIGLAKLPVLPLKRLELGSQVARQARLAALGLLHPFVQRLRRAAYLARYRDDRRPPRRMLMLVIHYHPHR